jgi:DNA polymerase-3 subunit alpha (Gram-positive type)
MSQMNEKNREKFSILLEQIQLNHEPYLSAFQNAEIIRVAVNRVEKKWHFFFKFEQMVDCSCFEMFKAKCLESFSAITNIEITIELENQTSSLKTVPEYWNFVLHSLENLTPGLLNLLEDQSPIVEDGRIVLTVHSENEANLIKQRCATEIQEKYENIGLKDLNVFIKIDEQLQENKLKQFQEEILQKDVDYASQVLQSMSEQPTAKDTDLKLDNGPVKLGKSIDVAAIKKIADITDNDKLVSIEGYVFFAEARELRSGKQLLQIKITDYTDSILVKMFSKDKDNYFTRNQDNKFSRKKDASATPQVDDVEIFKKIKAGQWLRIQGVVQLDTFNQFNPEVVMMARDIEEVKPVIRQDVAETPEKRVELHVHSQMSQMDAITPIGEYVKRAKHWGHKAIAITDHGGLQAFPDAYAAGKKNDIKILYGLEAYLIDDGVPIAFNPKSRDLKDAEFVVFDVETTGLSANYCTIIEMGAVKVKEGEILDRFSEFANPHHPLSPKIIELTSITDDMLLNAPEVDDVLRRFKEWVGDAILVAHNASFDIGFLNAGYKKMGLDEVTNPVIDTLELARFLYPEFKSYGLGVLSKKLGVELTQHHRAIYDAEATGNVLMVMIKDLREKELTNLDQLNQVKGSVDSYKKARPSHCTILVQNSIGLKNLFKIVSDSNIKYLHRVPRVPKSLITKYREGLLIGSSCDEGEVFKAFMSKSINEVYPIADFYDYFEIHPLDVYEPLLEMEHIRSKYALETIIKGICQLGEETGKPVVATGNTHYIDHTDKIYRDILVRSQGGANEMNRHRLPDVHFRTTDEMLENFKFLGEEKAIEVVVTNTNKIADMIDVVKPIKDELYVPKIEGANEEIRELSYSRAHAIYGETLPEVVEARVEKELKSIIGHGFAVIYLISHKLVKKSLEDGYLVGSRGSVGSSLVATLTEITEVNPLPPHYVCPSCKHSEFFIDGSVASGYDLKDSDCPKCGAKYKKDGQDIPFETFLGFKGDKVPDIDLNFSGNYQSVAHNYTKALFGEDNVFRAGTIATVADKTAFGYVKGYLQENNIQKRNVEVERLASGTTGAKRTTGQHPGGIIVIPDYMDVYDFTPIQFPADNADSEWRTTHFDFHSIHDNVLKLDILGHDDPTVIRMLQDLSGIDPKTIPVDDPDVMKIFGSPEVLGVTEEQINCKSGTFGVPEFGTQFVRQMLDATKPSTFSELVQISGLSHGTDVWIGNAQELINNGTCTLKEVIGCRDDIMVYLIYQNLEPSFAFKIMESVRKGKGLSPDMEDEMKAKKVPKWYIDSCKKIKYMFPKAHAAAYVLMALRIAYFKVHMPMMFYAAYFSVRASDFEIDTMIKGKLSIKARLGEIILKGMDTTPKEKSLLTVLELANEMCQRGFNFKKIDLYKSAAKEFIIDGDSLIPPFISIDGLGENVALQIVRAREDGEFLSKEDLQKRGKVSKTIIEFMSNHGFLEDLPDENQLSFF